MEARTIVSKTEEDFLCYAEPEDVEELKDYKIQENILATCTTDAQVRNYFAATGNVAMRRLRIDHIIQEVIHCLKIQIFGDEHLGLQSFIQLKRTMITMKNGKDCGIKKWSQRINTYQNYLPRCLWLAGAKRGEWPEKYGEMQKREILEFHSQCLIKRD